MAPKEKYETCIWKLIKEQLLSLWFWHRDSPEGKEFHSFLTEVSESTYINLGMFTHISYFLVGIIDRKKRNELIKWPLISVTDRTLFRKGLSSIVKCLIEKYPNFNITTLNDSYLKDPNYNQEKIVDFILKLGNLAIYLTLNDSTLLSMVNISDLNANEIEISCSTIYKERISYEKLIKDNQFPIAAFEDVKMDITNKILNVKERNSNLAFQLSKLVKDLSERRIINKQTSSSEINCMKQMHTRKLDQLQRMNSELDAYSEKGKRILSSITSVRNSIHLKAEDLNMNGQTLSDATIKACQTLDGILSDMKENFMSRHVDEDYLKSVSSIKKAFLNENSLLESFILKHQFLETL